MNIYSNFLGGVTEELTRLLNLFTLSRSANTSHSNAQYRTRLRMLVNIAQLRDLQMTKAAKTLPLLRTYFIGRPYLLGIKPQFSSYKSASVTALKLNYKEMKSECDNKTMMAIHCLKVVKPLRSTASLYIRALIHIDSSCIPSYSLS